MADFETHPVGTASRIKALEEELRCALSEHDDHVGPLTNPDAPHWSNVARKLLKGADHD